jgi:hypothetical protein
MVAGAWLQGGRQVAAESGAHISATALTCVAIHQLPDPHGVSRRYAEVALGATGDVTRHTTAAAAITQTELVNGDDIV